MASIYPAHDTLRAHMLKLFESYQKATGTPPGMVCRRILRDYNFANRLRDGFDFRTKTYDRVIAGLAEVWPEGTRWPSGVPKPAKTETAHGAQGEGKAA